MEWRWSLRSTRKFLWILNNNTKSQTAALPIERQANITSFSVKMLNGATFQFSTIFMDKLYSEIAF